MGNNQIEMLPIGNIEISKSRIGNILIYDIVNWKIVTYQIF